VKKLKAGGLGFGCAARRKVGRNLPQELEGTRAGHGEDLREGERKAEGEGGPAKGRERECEENILEREKREGREAAGEEAAEERRCGHMPTLSCMSAWRFSFSLSLSLSILWVMEGSRQIPRGGIKCERKGATKARPRLYPSR
jgi:hypothetical protein